MGAIGYIVEEKIFGDEETLDPLLVVGYEGIAGFCFWVIALIVFQNVKCDNTAMCTNGVVEDTLLVFEDYKANPTLIFISVALIFVSLTVNSTGVGITKYGSAA